MSGSRGGKLIALGVVAGVGLALLLRKPPAETHAAPERAAPAPGSITPPAEATAAATSGTAASIATTLPSAAPSATARAAADAPTIPSVPPPPEVADLDELKTAEIRCYQKDPDACFRAATAYASGKLLPADEKRAENYRKIELTQLFRQCEKAAVRPCLILAERYAKGEGLPVDAKKAQKLQKHVTEVCQRRPAPECALLGAGLK